MKSMTGFGKGTASAECTGTFTVEIASVNRKQLEIRTSLPREFPELDPAVRRELAGIVERGSVSVKVQYLPSPEAGAAWYVNRALLVKLMEECHAASQQCSFPAAPVSAAELMTVPGVLVQGEGLSGDDAVQELFLRAMKQAEAAWDVMRRQEGSHLEKDLLSRLEHLKELLGQIRPLAEEIPGTLKRKIRERLAAEELADVQDERVLREVLFYADKADVTEEMTRLESHFLQFERYVNAPSGAGRSLDFLIQEMFREITTLSNKGGTCAISPLAVAFKSELEKIREQVQNIE